MATKMTVIFLILSNSHFGHTKVKMTVIMDQNVRYWCPKRPLWFLKMAIISTKMTVISMAWNNGQQQFATLNSCVHLLLRNLCVHIWPERAKTFPGLWLGIWSSTYVIVWPPTLLVQHYSEPKCYVTNSKS